MPGANEWPVEGFTRGAAISCRMRSRPWILLALEYALIPEIEISGSVKRGGLL
jgi:hypothetical protein